mmetsp:Transcript_21283/g.30023  ORF Transcript_21283/g.30023 Transcript_21283/m.30023 type:complete len:190 (-) Transcript_21283:72-641(-)
MGIDLIAGGRVKSTCRKAPKTQNVYIRLLAKLYRFMARRTESPFNKIVMKRLFMSQNNRPPLAISKLARFMKGKEDKIAVLVGTITDDPRLLSIPKMTVCALRVTATARARILKAGGEILTFDQLALRCPTGSGTILLKGKLYARTVFKHVHGKAPGTPGGHARPYSGRNTSKKNEKSRGRRNSKGFKN